MAKISPVSIKYIIRAKFEATGTLEKPDVIGALFGQTEGLLGDELELRELQKEGKIGRIDVNLSSENGRTTGKIEVPSSLDKAETTIVAAAIETIERMGPSDSKIEVEQIEDVRGNKREYIIERAKKLLETIEGSKGSQEMEDEVKLSSRVSKIQEHGDEKLPSGDISGNEIIVVEGRADVLSMLRAGVKNIIGMNGTILPEAVKELSKEKEITLFVDGDRGGMLIARNVIDNADIDFVVKAPDGKEVEELSPKEILSSLRKKIPVKEFLEEINKGARGYKGRERRGRTSYKREERSYKREEKQEDKEEEKEEKIKKLTAKETNKLRELMDDLTGTKGAILLDENLDTIKKVPLSQFYNLRERNIYAMVIDGTATMNIVKTAEKINCKHLAAGTFTFTDTYIDLVSL